jgi:hypothetical protein
MDNIKIVPIIANVHKEELYWNNSEEKWGALAEATRYLGKRKHIPLELINIGVWDYAYLLPNDELVYTRREYVERMKELENA